MDKKFAFGWWIPKEDKHFEEYFSQSISANGRSVYQPHHLAKCFNHIGKKNNTAIDVGGHCGFWSYYLGLNFDKVYAFEPVKIFAECFKKNVPFDHVELIPNALGDEPGTVSMNVDLSNTGATHVSKELNDEQIEVKRLDDYEFDNVDFVKIDVEGFENKVVLGAKETFIKHKPIIIIEQKGFSDRYQESQFEALETLKSYGAKVVEQVVKDYIVSWE